MLRGEEDRPFGKKALEVQEATTFAHTTETALACIAETLRVGVLLLDECGRPLFANRRARSILAERDGLELKRQAVRGVVPREAAQLRRAVAEAALGGPEAGAVLFLSRASGRSPLHVLVNNLRPSPTLASFPAGTALLFVIDAEEGCPISEGSLRRRYGMTPAEARVAARIGRGARPAEIARALGLCISTVRTHLQHVLDKTGTHHQSDLVRCMLTGAGGFHRERIAGDSPPRGVLKKSRVVF
jgi:DNA-binding CsgD family transcriptional regulator